MPLITLHACSEDSNEVRPQLSGAARCILVEHPLDGQTYSVAIKHLCPTEGAMALLRVLAARREQRHRKPLHAALCLPFLQGLTCPHDALCAAIHCTAEGLAAMRPWTPTPRTPKAVTCPHGAIPPLELQSHSPSMILSPPSPSSSNDLRNCVVNPQTSEERAAQRLLRLAMRMQGTYVGRRRADLAASDVTATATAVSDGAVKQSINRLRHRFEAQYQDLLLVYPPTRA